MAVLTQLINQTIITKSSETYEWQDGDLLKKLASLPGFLFAC